MTEWQTFIVPKVEKGDLPWFYVFHLNGKEILTKVNVHENNSFFDFEKTQKIAAGVAKSVGVKVS